MNVIALQPGSKIAGYEIKRVLGAGGFGITYEGFNPITHNRVAIKEFFPRGIVSRQGATIAINDHRDQDVFEKALRKFEDSTSKLCRLTHPNIVKVHDYIPGNKTGYMLMEYLEGDSVRGRLDRSPSKTLASADELRRIFEPVLDALRYIHNNSVLHRDLSPDNVMIVTGGRPVLIDFGALRDTKDSNRVSTLVVAREAYAPFEQLVPDGPPHGTYTDVYTIAATMYECLTGDPPVRASGRLMGARDPYVPLAKASKVACPPQIAAAIDHALKVRIEDRPQTIDAFMALLGWSASVPGSAHRPALNNNAPATQLVGSETETMAWNDARQKDQVNLYADFVNRYPASRFADAARERVAALMHSGLTQVVQSGGGQQFPAPAPSVPQFAGAVPSGFHQQPAGGEEAAWWAHVRNNRNPQDINQFLWRYPHSIHANEARAMLASPQAPPVHAIPGGPPTFGPSVAGIPPQSFPGAGYAPAAAGGSNVGAIIGIVAAVTVALGLLVYSLWPKPTSTSIVVPPPGTNQEVRIGTLTLHIDAECNQRRTDQGGFFVYRDCATNKLKEDAYDRRQNVTAVNQCVSLCGQDNRCKAFEFEGNECMLFDDISAISNIPGTAGVKK